MAREKLIAKHRGKNGDKKWMMNEREWQTGKQLLQTGSKRKRLTLWR